MAGLLDILSNISPEQNRGLLAAAAHILQQSGPSRTPFTLGQGIGAGIEAYQGSMEHQRARTLAEQEAQQVAELRGYAIKDKQSDYQAQELQLQRAKELATLRDSYQKTRGARPQSAPPMDRSANAVMQGMVSGVMPQMEAPGAPTAGGMPVGGQGHSGGVDLAALAQEHLEYAQFLRDNGQHEAAQSETDKALKLMPEFDTTPRTGNDASGKPFQYLVGKRGEKRILENTLPREELKLANLGGKDVAYNPFGLREGQEFKRTMTPGEAASNSLGWANHGISKERLSLDRQAQGPGGSKAPAGYRWAATGSLEAIPGGPATKGATATEGERKASTLLQRMEGAQQQMNAALSDDARADTPGLLSKGLRGVGAESLANTITGSERQRVEAAELDFLDAGLTLGTGAAYTREQLEGYRRSYFPQIGDTDDTIADKAVRRQRLTEAAQIAAGRAAVPTGYGSSANQSNGARHKSALPGQVMDGYRFKGGNPADRNAWEKL